MLEISKVEVYGLEESLVASGYPMKVDVEESESYESKLRRGSKLGNVPSGSGHNNFLKGIVAQFNVKYPQYWTPQFQRYNFVDIISSQSKMHRLTKMDIGISCNKYVDSIVVSNLEYWIDVYNNFENVCNEDGQYIDSPDTSKEYRYFKSELYMKIISNTPLGLELTMRVSTNYLQLRTIYEQRKSHKLEDWKVFCDWCETLPLFKELCLGGK